MPLDCGGAVTQGVREETGCVRQCEKGPERLLVAEIVRVLETIMFPGMTDDADDDHKQD